MKMRKIIRVADVMTHSFAMVDGSMTINEAVKVYKEREVSALFVNKRNEDDEFGILLLSDIAKKVLAKDRAPTRMNVYEVMTKPVIGVDPQMDVRYCARLFDQFGLSMAPVLMDGTVMGLISYDQIVLDGCLLSNE